MSLIRAYANQEDMRRTLTKISRNVDKLSSRLTIEKRLVNANSIKASLRRAMALSSIFDTLDVRSASKKFMDKERAKQAKRSSHDNVQQIVEQTQKQLEALNHIKTLLDKHFDNSNTTAVKMKEQTDKLIGEINDINADAEGLLHDRLEKTFPPLLKVQTEKLLKFIRTSGIDFKSSNLTYKVDTAPGQVSFISQIKIADVKTGGVKVDYYVYLTYQPIGKTNNYKLFIGVYNEPLTLEQLFDYKYGQPFVNIENAIDVLRIELGLNTKLAGKNTRVSEKKQYDNKPKYIENELTSFKIVKQNGVTLLQLGIKGVKDTAGLTPIMQTLFIAVKKSLDNVKANNGPAYKLNSAVVTDKNNPKQSLIELRFTKKDALLPSRVFINELFHRFGVKKNADAINKALRAFS